MDGGWKFLDFIKPNWIHICSKIVYLITRVIYIEFHPLRYEFMGYKWANFLLQHKFDKLDFDESLSFKNIKKELAVLEDQRAEVSSSMVILQPKLARRWDPNYIYNPWEKTRIFGAVIRGFDSLSKVHKNFRLKLRASRWFMNSEANLIQILKYEAENLMEILESEIWMKSLFIKLGDNVRLY